MQLIDDPLFRCHLDRDATSPAPSKAIWRAQHTCVAEGFSPNDLMSLTPAKTIINKQFQPKHWSVLKFAFVKLDFAGFPHDTAMQMARHQGNGILVQSLRYTGKRFCEAIEKPHLVEQLFYCQPVGEYASREGKYSITPRDRNDYFIDCYDSVVNYNNLIRKGIPEEVARRSLLSGYRQNFTISGTVQSMFHWLDQRTLADTQVECQTLAWMALTELEKWEPDLFGWYRENRAGKNKLAP